MIQWCRKRPSSVVQETAKGRLLAASFPYHAANAFDWRRRMLQRKQMQLPLLEVQRSVQPQAGSATHSHGEEWRDGVDLIHISSKPDRIDSRRCFVPGALTSTVASVRAHSRHGGTKNRSLEGVSVCECPSITIILRFVIHSACSVVRSAAIWVLIGVQLKSEDEAEPFGRG